eukprot:5221099-Prymnesium_polylepis.1
MTISAKVGLFLRAGGRQTAPPRRYPQDPLSLRCAARASHGPGTHTHACHVRVPRPRSPLTHTGTAPRPAAAPDDRPLAPAH